MRKIESFIAALLNEEHETAAELFSDYLLTRAQEIHEGLRQGDHPILAEDVEDEIKSEQYFTDEDLADEGDVDGEIDDAADDLADEMNVDAEEEVEADEDFGAEEEEEVEVADVDDRLEDIEAQLDELTAEFDRMMAEIDGEADDADDEVIGGEEEVETDVSGNAETEDMPVEESIEDFSHEDDFDDISEAIIDELSKVDVKNTEGRSTDGKSISPNTKSMPSARNIAGHPIKSKNVTHKGFDRETAPTSGRLPKGINTQDKADAKLTKVSKEGDKSAEINKPIKQNNVSPVAKPKK